MGPGNFSYPEEHERGYKFIGMLIGAGNAKQVELGECG